MIGFFEYQYLKYKKDHLRNLVALAKVDGHFHEDEKEFLFKVGKKYGLKPRQIERILDEPAPDHIDIPERHEQRVGQLYDVIGMVLADNVVDDNEMEFCQNLFERFGYKEELIDRMIKMNQNKEVRDYEDWEFFLEDSKVYIKN
jgi:uncharacterized membrane protein YebE (DUF533 family)